MPQSGKLIRITIIFFRFVYGNKKATMKKIFMLLFFIEFSLSAFAQKEKKITILHTNDLHSRLIGYAPESEYSPMTVNDDKTMGGFARIATIFRSEKEGNDGTTLIFDAGDFMMGTLFPSLERETGFQLRLMKTMGYDAIGLGNHEYDYGPEWLATVIEKSREKGDIPFLLTGNAVYNKEDNRDDALEKLFSDDIVGRKHIIIKDGLKFGIFSVFGKDPERVSPNAEPVTFSRQISYAKKMVKELQSEKCDFIICISHSGILKDKNGKWAGADFDLANAIKGIDLIIGGHSHTRLEQPLIVNGIPIVQAGEFGKYIGRLALTSSNGVIKIDNYRLIPVDDKVMGDKNVNQLIENQKFKISKDILEPLGMVYDKPVTETDFILEGNDVGNFMESNLGPLIADAIYYYVNSHTAKGTDISLVAAGMIFDRIVPGIQTAPDLFRVMPLGSGKDNVPGYPLSRLYFTGKELKSILEILLVAYKSSPDNYCYYSGFRVRYDPEKGLLKKIKKIEIVHSDGKIVNVDLSKKSTSLYSVTTDSYTLEFIGIIKKMSFGLINVVPKDSSGNRVTDMGKAVIDMNDNLEGIQEGKEWLALQEFLSSMKDVNSNGIPDIDRKYSRPVKTFYPINGKVTE
jgi:5'-nucleotidase/UDP-sugar diphosphatase